MKDKDLCQCLHCAGRTVGDKEVCNEAAERLSVLSPEMNRASPQAATDEQINNAAQIIAASFDYPWEEMPDEGKNNIRDIARRSARALLSAQPAAAIHYPECWDTAAYPTLASAIKEIGAFKCSTDECPAAQPQEAKAVAIFWQWVPKVPTQEMVNTGFFGHTPKETYERMLAAAPQEQAPAKPLADDVVWRVIGEMYSAATPITKVTVKQWAGDLETSHAATYEDIYGQCCDTISPLVDAGKLPRSLVESVQILVDGFSQSQPQQVKP